MWYVSLTGLAGAADGCSQVANLEGATPKKTCSRRSDIDKEVDMEIWKWYQDQQAKGSKPSWHEVSICIVQYHPGSVSYSGFRN
jgi:hypothetical protein